MTRLALSLLAAGLPGARVEALPQAWVEGLCADSRAVAPGDLFACLRGAHVDAARFIPEAIQRGAAAVMLDRDWPGRWPAGTGLIRVPDVAQALTRLAPGFYGHPALALNLVGVTGTNGKTTVTYLIRSIVESMGSARAPRRVGLVGTIGHVIAGRSLPSHNTTPMAWDLQKLLEAMVAARCDTAVLEVSSHALDQDRVAGCEFDVAVFTNLTQDHLDYHKTLPAYARAKRRLFERLANPGWKTGVRHAVVNADDAYGARMAQAARGAKVITYGLGARSLVRAQKVQAADSGTAFVLKTPRGSLGVRLPLLGEYNVYNALAAATAGLALGASLPQIKAGLERVAAVPGRLERIRGRQPFSVVVDFAHTPDALEKALQNVRAWTRGKVWAVFGCGGERDAGKRPLMGAVAARLADQVVLTSDNPRSEDPAKILRQILAGCRSHPGTPVQVEADRRRAIAWALRQARPGDTVLLAGKGHETYQILGNRVVDFDDRRVAREGLERMGYIKRVCKDGKPCKA